MPQLRRLIDLDDGQRLPEGPAIVQYLAERVPRSKPAPAAGTMERHRLFEWLHFIGTERHKADSALSLPSMPEEVMAVGGERPLERCRSGSRG